MLVDALHRDVTAERRTFEGSQGWVIEVSLPNAKYAIVAMPQTQTIAQLKAVITEHGDAVRANTGEADIMLRQNGQDLKSRLTLQQTGLCDNAKVTLIVRIIGASRKSRRTTRLLRQQRQRLPRFQH